MKVKELIEQLQKTDPDLVVVIPWYDDDPADYVDIKYVEELFVGDDGLAVDEEELPHMRNPEQLKQRVVIS